MWINLNANELEVIDAALYKLMASTAHDEAKAVRERIKEWETDARSPLHKHFNEVAFNEHNIDGELEIDRQSDDTAMVSISEDGGAYVLAWVWVDDDQADICTECGDFPGSETYGTVGDGFNGLCPSCADKQEADEEDE